MRKIFQNKYKKGAASIYIIVVTTMLFGVITIGFIHLISNELKRSEENSLSQSAYDSALAGVEDAKLALSKYYSCLNEGASAAPSINADGEVTCPEVLYYIQYDEKNPDYCDVVSSILNRNGEANPEAADYEGKEVLVEEDYAPGSSGTTQAYTCVKLDTKPGDYRSVLSSTNTIRVIPLRAVNRDANVKMIRVSWFSINNGTEYQFNNVDGNKIEFNELSESAAATPPTIVAQLYQTSEGEFSLSQFNNSEGNKTDRGTLWLVPTNDSANGKNFFEKDKLVASNNHNADRSSNTGYQVKCSTTGEEEYACYADIELPDPIGGNRSTRNGTFMLVLSIPYAQPTTDFKVEMYKETTSSEESKLYFDNVQVAVDSTGRANDLLSRTESRIEFSDVYFPYPEYAMQLGAGGGTALSKDFWVTYNCWNSGSDGVVNPCKDSGTEN